MYVNKESKERKNKRKRQQTRQIDRKSKSYKRKKYENGTMVYKKVGIYTINKNQDVKRADCMIYDCTALNKETLDRKSTLGQPYKAQ